MKHLIEGQKQYVASVSASVVMDEQGCKIWANEKEQIAKFKNETDGFTFYEPVHDGDDSTYTKVYVKAADILKLADFINAQRKIITESFFD